LSIHEFKLQEIITAMSVEVNEDLYIGLVLQGLEYNWTDSSPTDYFNWEEFSPNYDKASACVSVSHTTGRWRNVPCSSSLPYACGMPRNIDIPTDDVIEKCPHPYEDYTRYDGACYRIYAEEKTWQDAEDFCVTKNAHLASVIDVHEKSFLYAMWESMDTTGIWIGFFSSEDGRQFGWSDSYQPSLADWAAGQPPPPSSGRCVIMGADGRGRWAVQGCEGRRGFVCKAYDGGPVPPAAPPADGHCPPHTATNWTQRGGGYCYAFRLGSGLSWNDARLSCRQEGAELVSVQSASEQAHLVEALAGHPDPVWSGLTRPSEHEPYAWSDGAALAYVGWAAGQPSDNASHCVALRPETRLWDDIDCHVLRLAYVCKVAKSGGSQATETFPPLVTEFAPQTTAATPEPPPTPTDPPPSAVWGAVGAVVGVAVAGGAVWAYRRRRGMEAEEPQAGSRSVRLRSDTTGTLQHSGA